MKRRMTALLLTLALLISCFAAPAQAASWPSSSDIEMSCYSQDDTSIKTDMGMFPNLGNVEYGLYMSPTIKITNSTSYTKTFNMYWKVDGNKITFGSISLSSGKKGIYAMSESSARNYYSEGIHYVEVYIDNSSVYTYFYYVSNSGSSSGSSSSSGSGSSRSTVCNFAEYGMTHRNFTVSGLVWKYKSNTRNTGAKTNKTASAAQVRSTINNGGSYGLNYKITAKGFSGSYTFDEKIVIVTPDNYEYTMTGSITISSKYTYQWYDYLGENFFPSYYNARGDIKSGTYKFFLYFDGMLVDYSTLYLN